MDIHLIGVRVKRHDQWISIAGTAGDGADRHAINQNVAAGNVDLPRAGSLMTNFQSVGRFAIVGDPRRQLAAVKVQAIRIGNRGHRINKDTRCVLKVRASARAQCQHWSHVRVGYGNLMIRRKRHIRRARHFAGHQIVVDVSASGAIVTTNGVGVLIADIQISIRSEG